MKIDEVVRLLGICSFISGALTARLGVLLCIGRPADRLTDGVVSGSL
jgi:hypothetical protein